MLNLHLNARPDERFHLQVGEPVPHVSRPWWGLGLVKRVSWSNLWMADGTPGSWESIWVLGNAFYRYWGTCKCDGTRTRMYWQRQLEDGQSPAYEPNPNCYVMTTTPREMWSVRFFVDPNDPQWNAMGGS